MQENLENAVDEAHNYAPADAPETELVVNCKEHWTHAGTFWADLSF